MIQVLPRNVPLLEDRGGQVLPVKGPWHHGAGELQDTEESERVSVEVPGHHEFAARSLGRGLQRRPRGDRQRAAATVAVSMAAAGLDAGLVAGPWFVRAPPRVRVWVLPTRTRRVQGVAVRFSAPVTV
jgi:hypothetical protein